MSTYRPQAIAEMLDVKVDVVYGWIAAGELRAANAAQRRAGKPRWRISQEALDQFLRSRQSVKPAPPARRRRRPQGVPQYF